MQDDVVEIESNMISSGKSRIRSESGEREKRKQKEQIGTSGTNKSQEDKIEEMSRIIKYLSNKLARMETERRRPDNRNPNQFRRPFNPPQVLQRERRNEDQPIQAPIKNENLVDNLVEEEFEDIDEEINMMEGDLSDMYILLKKNMRNP
jgi:chromosome segregation ATPase